jgi:transcription factor IIIB subunit 2
MDFKEMASYRENPLAYIENTLSFENQQLKGAIIHKDGEYNQYTGSGARFLSSFRFHKAQKMATKMGSILNLEGSVVSAAQQLYKLVQSKNWIQGRSTSLVILACLYYVCRQNETGHLMIDFSDVLNIDVYSLSKMYLKLARDMNLEVKLTDPSMYVPRFMRALNFPKADEKKILEYVLRLLARMREDWLGQGRRPTGLIAAGFWIACKCFNVQKSMKEISLILKVSEETIRKRVNEFKNLKVAKLTKEEFERAEDLGISFDPEDPPSFKRLRIKSDKEETIREEKSKQKALQNQDNKILDDNNDNDSKLQFNDLPIDSAFKLNEAGELMLKDLPNSNLVHITADYQSQAEKNPLISRKTSNLFENKSNLDVRANETQDKNLNTKNNHLKDSNDALGIDTDQVVDVNKYAIVPLTVDESIIRADEFDDQEISACILQPHESKFKRLAWYKLHSSWLREQKMKEERKEDLLKKSKKIKRRTRDSKDSIEVTSMHSNNEVVNSILRSKLANKVNTAALEKLFADAKNFKSND